MENCESRPHFFKSRACHQNWKCEIMAHLHKHRVRIAVGLGLRVGGEHIDLDLHIRRERARLRDSWLEVIKMYWAQPSSSETLMALENV